MVTPSNQRQKMRSLSDCRYWKFDFDCLKASNFWPENPRGGPLDPPSPLGRPRVNVNNNIYYNNNTSTDDDNKIYINDDGKIDNIIIWITIIIIINNVNILNIIISKNITQ